LLVFLVYGTGVVADDYIDLAHHAHSRWFQGLVPEGNLINVPVFNLMRMVFYVIADPEHPFAIDLAKTAYVVATWYMLSRFFGLFLSLPAAMLTTLVFLFYPSHESTVFWLACQHLTLSAAFYGYAYYQARRERLGWAVFLAALASFTSYASPIIAGSLFLVAALEGRYRLGVALVLPNVVYAVYYVVLSKLAAVTVSRLPAAWSAGRMVKQFLLQTASFIDATVGPSFWLKTYYSVWANDAVSLAVGLAAVIGYYLIGGDVPAPVELEN
jgi:hypothetical protein